MHRSVSRFLRTLVAGIAAVLLCGIVPVDSRAWEYRSHLRCAGDLISAGNTVARLVDRCGRPTERSRTEAYTTEEPVYENSEDGSQVQTGTTTVEHPAYETWTYRYGRGHFSYHIYVNDEGYITSIREGRYGGLR